MYHFLRSAHKWVGLINAVLLLVISATGFLLAMKSSVSWIRPEEKSGEKIESFEKVISVDEAMKAAFAQNQPFLSKPQDVDRVDYRPKRNVYKVVAKKGYTEVQVDGSTGKVLQVATRVDQLTEDIHDFSIVSDPAHQFGLPIVAISLFLLSGSGIVMFFVPVVRRAKYKRSQVQSQKGP